MELVLNAQTRARLAVAACLLFGSITAFAQQPPASSSISSLRADGLRALQKGDNKAAIKLADRMLEAHPEDPRAMRLAGDIYLRCGKVKSAVKQFDAYLQVEPAALPGLWQRGIALYFAGDYKRGAEQFEEHRKVNPNDVENAAWHFLCVAKAESFEKARQMLLPAPGDPRIPMEEVLEMLRSGDTQRVSKRVKAVPAGSPARADAEFYGDFYLGLYADAQGNVDQARQYLGRAAKDAPHHYMGDVARVYAAHLAE